MTSIRSLVVALCLASAALGPPVRAEDIAASGAKTGEVYGANAAAGRYFTHDGVRLYYEVYGEGPPLLMIHGNGASIWSLRHQIDYFRHRYQVIVMDSRDHGRSSDAPGRLTFETMTDDLSALLEHVHAAPALVLGWSDGAIEALLLGLRHPEQVKMIASMAANLDPGGLAPEFAEPAVPAAPEEGADAKPNRAQRVEALDRDEPHIRAEALEAIAAPTLILASDHDAVRDEHTLLIYHHLRNSQLAIFPDATHMIPLDDPARFNATVDRFFSSPFVERDRVADTMSSIRKADADSTAEH